MNKLQIPMGDSEKFYGGLEADIPGPVSKLDGQSQHFAK